MSRPPRSPIVPAAIAGLVLVVAGLGVLLAGRPGQAPADAAGGSPIAASPSGEVVGPSIDPAACALEQEPGPDDKPPAGGGDAIDVADLGGGRWRLCLSAPEVIVVEGKAWCTWNDDRTVVREVAGLPTADGAGGQVDGGVALDRREVYVGLTNGRGELMSFQGGLDRALIQGQAGGTRGIAAFQLAPLLDPEHPPVVAPPDRRGLISWGCGAPPPPRPGRSTGRVELRLDDLAGAVWHVPGACSWVTTRAGPRLLQVETLPPAIERDGAKLAIIVRPDHVNPDRGETSLWVDRNTGGAFYQGAGESISIRQAPDGSAGLIRMRRLRVDGNGEVLVAPGVGEVSGVVSWTCPRPPVAGPAEADPEPGEEAERHPGEATLRLSPAVIGELRGTITCTIERSDPAYVRISSIEGWLVAGGIRFRLRSDGGTLLLGVVGPDGQPAGEYEGQIGRIGDEAGRGPLEIGVAELMFVPTDPRYAPLGGPDAPRSLRLDATYTCAVPKT